MVGFTGEPAIVDDAVIAYVKKRACEDVQPAGLRRFRPGDAVLIKDEPFRDLAAIFDGNLSARGRVRVLLTTMCRTVSCDVDESWLEQLS